MKRLTKIKYMCIHRAGWLKNLLKRELMHKMCYAFTHIDQSINQSISLLCKKAGHTIHVNVRQVKVDLYKFTLLALSAL